MAEESPAPKPKRVSVFIKLFVLCHVLGITIWALPDPRPAIQNGSIAPIGTDWILYYNWLYLKRWKPVRAYLNTAGNWQYWDMFAPNPSSADLWGDAEVVYQDGTVKRYPYYRMYTMPIWQKYFKERFRKFYERAGNDQFRYLWPPFARRVAHEMDTVPGNPPVKVRLWRHFQFIDPPPKPPPTKYESFMYYEHEVDQAQLAKDRTS